MATRKPSKPSKKSLEFNIAGASVLTEEARHQNELKHLRRQLDEAIQARILDQTYEQFISRILQRKVVIPDWTLPRRNQKHHQVIPMTNLSDAHFDEVVRPEEVQHRNGYNRDIAERRLKLYFTNVIKVAHNYVHGFEYPGIVINLLGDMFSGCIHEELQQTNEDTIVGSILHWRKQLGAGLKQLADAFGKVWVTGVVGNHPRNTKKPRMKMRARDNFDWLLYQLLRSDLEGDRRFEWLIADGQKLLFKVYDHKFIASHGDECKGGSGIAGMLSPQLIAMARMKKMYDFDTWILGHWHCLGAYRGIRVNGSLKGYDEYAAIQNFDYQPPQQDFFLVAPGRGITASWPIFCAADNEPWHKRPDAARPFST